MASAAAASGVTFPYILSFLPPLAAFALSVEKFLAVSRVLGILLS
jgi:hypothetical protein